MKNSKQKHEQHIKNQVFEVTKIHVLHEKIRKTISKNMKNMLKKQVF